MPACGCAVTVPVVCVVHAAMRDAVQHPNLVHMLQTAEAMRAAGHPDWFQLVGLLHDLGKLMFLWGDKETGQEVTRPWYAVHWESLLI